jgi:Holliday junction resolvase
MNVKKKGNAGENRFANWLQANGIKAFKNSSSGANTNKSDVHNSLNANFEVKTVKRINLQDAWKQSRRDAEMSHATPYVVIHFDGMPQDEWLMVMHSEDWLDLVKQNAPIETQSYTDPKVVWAIKRMVDAAKVVIKSLEKYG